MSLLPCAEPDIVAVYKMRSEDVLWICSDGLVEDDAMLCFGELWDAAPTAEEAAIVRKA
jgi:hypothetical protein